MRQILKIHPKLNLVNLVNRYINFLRDRILKGLILEKEGFRYKKFVIKTFFITKF